MILKPIRKWQRIALVYLFLCLVSAVAIFVYADSLLKPILLWQFILASPLWLVVKPISILVGGFWLPLFSAAIILSMATIAPSIRFSRNSMSA
jgi:CHASE2 domain-containing sensor protein